MKKTFLVLLCILCINTFNLQAQCGGTAANTYKPTSVGIVIYSNDVETLWNALRFANYSKTAGDTVSIFLLGKGVELDNLVKTDENLKEQSDTFLDGGTTTILGCGTCLQSRKMDQPQVCKFSSLKDLYELVRKNKIVLTF
jgi:hypothetical protein